MKSWKCILVTLAVVALASSAFAQLHGPGIGVYFDEAGTQQFASLPGGNTQYHTAYVYAVNADLWVGGMAFKLDMDPRIGVMAAEYPNAIKLGEPDSGVSIGFSDCRNGHVGNIVLGCILTLWTGTQLMTNAEIKVVDHPTEGGILLADCDAELFPVQGFSAFLTITVDAEPTTWGGVKGLYR